MKKDFSESATKLDKPKAGTRNAKKKPTKVVKKKPLVQVMVNPKTKDRERQRSVPIGKDCRPAPSKDDPYSIRPSLGFHRQNSKVSRSQNLKRVLK